MRYKVFDTRTKSFVIDNSSFILKPDGRLAVNEYGDEIGVPYCIPIFFPTDNDNAYIDNVGGIHDSGTGNAPNGDFCGECSKVSCETCSVWKSIKE